MFLWTREGPFTSYSFKHFLVQPFFILIDIFFQISHANILKAQQVILEKDMFSLSFLSRSLNTVILPLMEWDSKIGCLLTILQQPKVSVFDEVRLSTELFLQSRPLHL